MTDRLVELYARDRDGIITEDEYVELMAAKGKPQEQARQQFRTVARLRELPPDYHKTMVM